MPIDETTKKNYNSWAEYLTEYKKTLIRHGFTSTEAFTLVRDLHGRLLESGIKPVWLKDLN